MKYTLKYGLGQLKFDIKIQLEDILRLSPTGDDNDETRLAERSRDINDIIGALYLKPSETKKKKSSNDEKKKNKPESKYDKNKIKDILTEDELKVMEKYVFSFEAGNNKLFKEYWEGRKKTDIPLITAIFFRCILRIKHNYKDDLDKLWEDWNLITESFNESIYTSKDEAIGFIRFKVEQRIEKEKERLGESINNKYKSNKKIMDLQNTSIDNIVNELIIADDPNNNEKNIYLNMIIIRDSLFKIIEYRRKLLLNNQIKTDELMEEIIKLYNILPKESRYDATYKNLRKLKADIEFKIQEIDSYMNIYKREAIKSCKVVNEYKNKEEKLKKDGKREEAEEIAEKCIDVETQFNKKMRRKMDTYTDMSLKRMDLEIEKMDMKKYNDDNIMNSMIKLIKDINS